MSKPRNICFITGTRAEFGLMRPVLDAIKAHPRLRLQLIVTGMHLQAAHGRSINTIRKEGWTIDATVPWGTPTSNAARLAEQTGAAMAKMAGALAKLKSDVVLVVGDRVEAFAAASAAHIAGIPIAHIHGGDRALGQIDDSLRHAITKLSHIHFPATRQSAARIRKLGEDADRIVIAGSPGLDGIDRIAAPNEELLLHFPQAAKRRFGLLVLHPATPDDRQEHDRAHLVLHAALAAHIKGDVPFKLKGTLPFNWVIVYPNSDPGSRGIIRAWEGVRDERVTVRADVPRHLFLALMRDAAVMVGNSSAGIIEAASFGTPVVDIGPRQLGRERSRNCIHVDYDPSAITAAIRNAKPSSAPNVYGSGGAARIITDHLAAIDLVPSLLRKIIAY
jgi:GDP/UDP-N,N'-diacetylbacillosamine 2-epimerase (hydrolysing)